jgi:hypothetical protein
MPSKLLWNVLSAFRVPSRWDPLLMTALLPLAALGLQMVAGTLEQRRRFAGVAVVAAALVVSFVELSTHRPAHFRTVPVPAEYSAVKSGTPNGILAEYPPGYSDIYRLWQRVHGASRERRAGARSQTRCASWCSTRHSRGRQTLSLRLLLCRHHQGACRHASAAA